MARYTFEIADEIKNRIIDGVCYRNGFTDEIMQDGVAVPNPTTKEQFFINATYSFWQASTTAKELEDAIIKTKEEVLNKAQAEINITPVS